MSVEVRTGERYARVGPPTPTVEIVVDGVIFKTDVPTNADGMRIAAQTARAIGIATAPAAPRVEMPCFTCNGCGTVTPRISRYGAGSETCKECNGTGREP